MKPITVDMPYPSIKDLKKDVKSAYIIAPSYTGLKSEITAILQYVYHAHFFAACGEEKTAETLEQIAMAEMKHLEVLGETILTLGVKPVYAINDGFNYNYYNTSMIKCGTSPKIMLLEDIEGELNAIATYEEQIKKLCNDDVKAIIARIKLDEELHVLVLKGILSDYS